MMDQHHDPDPEAWDPVPSPMLFILLLLVAAGFVLTPYASDEHHTDRWVRLSPFICLYDSIERAVELGLGMLAREQPSSPASNEEPPADIKEAAVVYPPAATAGGTLTSHMRKASRILVMLSFMCLSTLRNAGWTQLFAVLYVLHWGTNSPLPKRHRALRTTSQNDEIRRVTGLLFSLLCHVVIYLTATTGAAPSTLTLALANGIIFALVSVLLESRWTLNSHPPQQKDHNLGALLAHIVTLIFSTFIWLLSYSPAAWQHKPLSASAPELARLHECMQPVFGMHFAGVAICLSRRSLSLAHPGLKMAVGASWLGMGGVYYLYWHGVYADMGFPTAEGPEVVSRLWDSVVRRRSGL